MAHIVAVCGGSVPEDDQHEAFGRAKEYGRVLAELGCALVYGACPGFPEAVVEGFLNADYYQATERVLAISMAGSKEEHTRKEFPLHDLNVTTVFTGLGMGRNPLIIQASDAVLFFLGGYGTLSEFAAAMKMGRPVIATSRELGSEFNFSTSFFCKEKYKGEDKARIHVAETPDALRELLPTLPPPGNRFAQTPWGYDLFSEMAEFVDSCHNR